MIADFFEKYPMLRMCEGEIQAALDLLIEGYQAGGKLLICGNGGSAADCGHIVGELMKGFLKKRPVTAPWAQGRLGKLQQGLPAIDLTAHSALIAAFANDVDAALIYAQQVLGYGKQGDMFLGISTSGNAENVCLGAQTARALGLHVIGLTGADGGNLKNLCDICVKVPAFETPDVQELHLPVYHLLCAGVEAAFFE